MLKSLMKKSIFIIILILIFFNLLISAPAQLRVSGKNIVRASDSCQWRLVGVNICGLEWDSTGMGPPNGSGGNISQSVSYAISNWKSNCVRIPLNQDFWFGYRGANQTTYRGFVDNAVSTASNLNAYVELDLHWSGTGSWGTATGQQNMFDNNATQFWQDVATRYANNPAVIFNIYNEPHDVSWSVWRNGGSAGSFNTPGHQSIVNTIRGTGANNIIVAGGLAWAYDMTGIASNALTDTGSGYGIAYEAHIYPNKSDNTSTGWNSNVSVAVNAGYCVIIGEFGPATDGSQDNGGCTPFETNLINWINNASGSNNSANYVYSAYAWCWHTGATPRLISDWSFNPTSCHGSTVKNWLAAVPTPNCGGTSGTATFTPSRTRTPTPTASRTSTITPTPTRTSTPTVSRTVTVTNTRTPTPTYTRTPSSTYSSTATRTNTPAATNTWTGTATRTVTATLTRTNTQVITSTFTITRTGTPTYSRTATQTNTLVATFTRTGTPTLTGTNTQVITSTFTMTRTGTPTYSRTNTPYYSATQTPTGTQPTATNTAVITNTHTNTQIPTSTNTQIITNTFTQTITITPTLTRTATTGFSSTYTNTRTPTIIYTNTLIPTESFTSTRTITSTLTLTITLTYTSTPTFTRTNTPTFTVTDTISSNTPTTTPTLTLTRTATTTYTVTLTQTPTYSNTITSTYTATITPTETRTITLTWTPTPSYTRTVTLTWTATSSYTGTCTITVTPSITPTYTQTLVPDSEEYKIEDIVIYPNPYNPGNGQDLNISFKVSKRSKMIKVRIFTTGFRLIKQIIFADKIYNAGIINTVEIPNRYLVWLANGAYYVIIYAKNIDGAEVKSKPETLLILR